METKTISKWAKTGINSYGQRVPFKMVVTLIPDGKNKKGKPKFQSITKHIPD